MDVVYARCCGVDVHKESIAVCVLIREPGQGEQKHKAHFSTVTAELLRCATGGGSRPGSEPDSESAGRRKHQAGFGSERCGARVGG